MTTSAAKASESIAALDESRALEPDNVWKSNLRKQIEDTLGSMFDDAHNQFEEKLAQAPVDEAARERLRVEHEQTITRIRRIANDQYKNELERERQERRWAAGKGLDRGWNEAMVREQQAIWDKLKRDGGSRSEAAKSPARTGSEGPPSGRAGEEPARRAADSGPEGARYGDEPRRRTPSSSAGSVYQGDHGSPLARAGSEGPSSSRPGDERSRRAPDPTSEGARQNDSSRPLARAGSDGQDWPRAANEATPRRLGNPAPEAMHQTDYFSQRTPPVGTGGVSNNRSALETPRGAPSVPSPGPSISVQGRRPPNLEPTPQTPQHGYPGEGVSPSPSRRPSMGSASPSQPIPMANPMRRPSQTLDDITENGPSPSRSAGDQNGFLHRPSLASSPPKAPEFWHPTITPEQDASISNLSRNTSQARRTSNAGSANVSMYRAPSIVSIGDRYTSSSPRTTDPVRPGPGLTPLDLEERERASREESERQWAAMSQARERERQPQNASQTRPDTAARTPSGNNASGQRSMERSSPLGPSSATYSSAGAPPISLTRGGQPPARAHPSMSGYSPKPFVVEGPSGMPPARSPGARGQHSPARSPHASDDRSPWSGPSSHQRVSQSSFHYARSSSRSPGVYGPLTQHEYNSDSSQDSDDDIVEHQSEREREAQRAREEEARKKEEELKRKEQLQKVKEEEARKREEEFKRKEEDARKKEEEMQRREAELKRREEELAQAETRRKEEEIREREEKLRQREEELARREAEAKRKEEEAKRKEAEARRREADAAAKAQQESKAQRDKYFKPPKPHQSKATGDPNDSDSAESVWIPAVEPEPSKAQSLAEEERLRQEEEFRRRQEEIHKRNEDRKRNDSTGASSSTAYTSTPPLHSGAFENSSPRPDFGQSWTSASSSQRAGSTTHNTNASAGFRSSASSSASAWSSSSRPQASNTSSSTRTTTPPTSKKSSTASSFDASRPFAGSAAKALSEAEWQRRQEEQARRQQEAFRKEQERAEREARERASRSMGKVETKQLFTLHDRQWQKVKENTGTITWSDFPWPTLKYPTEPDALTSAAISSYMLSPHQDDSRNAKDRVREHIKRWHPDRFETQILPKVLASERERVKLGAGAVARALNELLTRV